MRGIHRCVLTVHDEGTSGIIAEPKRTESADVYDVESHYAILRLPLAAVIWQSACVLEVQATHGPDGPHCDAMVPKE